ncbi:hypothetical protein BgiBS90_032636, partial [Biomphalaria glabrata]
LPVVKLLLNFGTTSDEAEVDGKVTFTWETSAGIESVASSNVQAQGYLQNRTSAPPPPLTNVIEACAQTLR